MSEKNTYDSTIAEKARAPLAMRLQQLTAESGVSALAAYLDCSVQAVNQYRQGTSFPKTENLIKISNFYNVSVDYLLGITKTKNRDTTVQAVCEYTGLSEIAVEAIKRIDRKDVLNLVLESPFFADIVNMLVEAIEDPYLHEQGSLIAADVIMRGGLAFDGAENVNYPSAYKHFTNVLSKHGISALYKQKFVEIASKLYDRLTNEET